MALIRRVRLFCQAKEAEIRARTGLTEPQFTFLRLMPSTGMVRTGDLSRMAGLSPSRGGRVADEMVRLGHLDRVPDPDDRRVLALRLAPKGRATLRRIDDLVGRCDEVLWQRLPAPDLDNVVEALKVLVRTIEAA